MKKSKFGLLTIALGVFLALFVAGAGQAQAATTVGGLDLSAYCKSLGYANSYTVGSTAYDWRCRTSGGSLASLSTTDACHAQYGYDTIDRTYDFYSNTSWECWRIRRDEGGVDVGAYCRSLGYTSSYTVGSGAYDWRCRTSGGLLTSLSMTDVCHAQHGFAAIDRFSDFYSNTSWKCYS
jgi:hypothetical protein